MATDAQKWLLDNRHSLLIKGPAAAAEIMGISTATLKTRIQNNEAFTAVSTTGAKVNKFSPVMILANYLAHWSRHMGYKKDDLFSPDFLGDADASFERYLTDNRQIYITNNGLVDTPASDKVTLSAPVSHMLKLMADALYAEYVTSG